MPGSVQCASSHQFVAIVQINGEALMFCQRCGEVRKIEIVVQE